MNGTALFEMWNAQSGITDLLGSGSNMRLYPHRKNEDLNTVPYGTYRLLPSVPVNHFNGESQFFFRSVDFMLYSRDKVELDTLVQTVKTAISGQKGVFGGIIVNYTEFMSDDDDYMEDLDLHSHRVEYRFNYRQ